MLGVGLQLPVSDVLLFVVVVLFLVPLLVCVIVIVSLLCVTSLIADMSQSLWTLGMCQP